MRRSDRLFQIVNLLRNHQPLTGKSIAERLEVSVRTIYRDIDDLSVSGIPIYGERGIGYRLVEGFELKGKTLGVIGLGHIGSRVAELGLAIGMKVIAYNRTPGQKEGVEMKSLDEVLAKSDVISLHLAENEETKGIISKDRIAKLKKGVVIVNTADRSLVDEEAMAQALKSGQVDSYALEAEDLTSPPLGGLENAILSKGFGWFTKEALERNKEIWVNNIEGIAKGKPVNPLK